MTFFFYIHPPRCRSLNILESYLRSAGTVAPIVDEMGRTPLDTALFNNEYGHCKKLLDAYIKNDVSCLASLKYPLKTLASRYPGLMAEFLDRCKHQVKSKHVRLPIHKPLLAFSQNVASPWNKQNEEEFCSSNNGKIIRTPVEAYIIGFPNFLSFDGPFFDIVKSGNLDIFRTETMQVAIRYKWKTYGCWIYTVQSGMYALTTLMFSLTQKLPELFSRYPECAKGGIVWMVLNAVCIFLTVPFFVVELREVSATLFGFTLFFSYFLFARW